MGKAITGALSRVPLHLLVILVAIAWSLPHYRAADQLLPRPLGYRGVRLVDGIRTPGTFHTRKLLGGDEPARHGRGAAEQSNHHHP